MPRSRTTTRRRSVSATRDFARVRAGFSTRDAVSPWTARVVELGEALVAPDARRSTALAGPFTEACGTTSASHAATLTYDGEPADQVADLDARLEADIERGVTGDRPHISTSSGSTPAGGISAVFGSQGEQRVSVLALVLAEADVLARPLGGSPLVLLDDVLSELDGERRQALARMIPSGGSQTVVTATSVAALPIEPAQALSVTPGQVR